MQSSFVALLVWSYELGLPGEQRVLPPKRAISCDKSLDGLPVPVRSTYGLLLWERNNSRIRLVRSATAASLYHFQIRIAKALQRQTILLNP